MSQSTIVFDDNPNGTVTATLCIERPRGTTATTDRTPAEQVAAEVYKMISQMGGIQPIKTTED